MGQPRDVLGSEIWNCEHAFEFRCPRTWESLAPTAVRGVRHCDVCRRDVHMSRSPEEFVRNGEAGRCVAVPQTMTPDQTCMDVLGRPSVSYLKRLEMRRDRCRTWWEGVLARNPSFSRAALEEVRRNLGPDPKPDAKRTPPGPPP